MQRTPYMIHNFVKFLLLCKVQVGLRINKKVFLQGVPEAVLNVLANTNATVTNLVTGLTYEFKVNFA